MLETKFRHGLFAGQINFSSTNYSIPLDEPMGGGVTLEDKPPQKPVGHYVKPGTRLDDPAGLFF